MIDIYRMEGMPSSFVINQWLQDAKWHLEYARARERMSHVIAETAIKEATENTTEDPQFARLKFDARRWLVGKIAPRIYGDKTTHTIEAGESYVEALRLANDKMRQKEREARRIIDVDPETGNEVKKLGNNADTRKRKNAIISNT